MSKLAIESAFFELSVLFTAFAEEAEKPCYARYEAQGHCKESNGNLLDGLVEILGSYYPLLFETIHTIFFVEVIQDARNQCPHSNGNAGN